MKIDWSYLGLNKGDRIVVAMSGGVDSSVTAALMVEAGFDVIGLTMQLYDNGQIMGKKGACCAGQDIYDARQVADKLGFPHYVLDYESKFKESVMDDFADTYLAGHTPIPCVRCNQTVKFKDLLTTAKDLGAVAMATGHYMRQLNTPSGVELHKAIDESKDQSYFLFATTKEQASFLKFPLGTMSKSETREHAERFGLQVADKPDSQDICFVPDGNYARIVSKLRPGALEKGQIKHLDGTILGQHDGIINFTVGQRKGLGIAAPEPLYVVKIDAATHTVYVGSKENLSVKSIFVKDLNWLGEQVVDSKSVSIPVSVKVRSTRPPVPAHLTFLNNGRAKVDLEIPEYGVSPGQACVLYDDTRLLGGGWILGAEIEPFRK